MAIVVLGRAGARALAHGFTRHLRDPVQIVLDAEETLLRGG